VAAVDKGDGLEILKFWVKKRAADAAVPATAPVTQEATSDAKADKQTVKADDKKDDAKDVVVRPVVEEQKAATATEQPQEKPFWKVW